MSAEKSRIIIVGVLALCLLACVALLRPQDRHGVPETTFWNGKFSMPANFNVVAVGDSRVLHGINMQAFEDEGFGKGLNFGFRGASTDSEYFTAAAERFGDRGKKILIVGITPNGFTDNAMASSGFSQKRDDYEDKSSEYSLKHYFGAFSMPSWYRSIEQRFQPVKLAEISRFASGRKNLLQETYHPNGWIESAHEKPNEDYALRFFKVRFDGNPPQPKNIDMACECLKSLIDSGVEVFAFKPPVSDSMTEIETEKSGFDYAAFERKFSELGGVWIDVDASRFQTYDGSHLISESAREFSQWLATTIGSRMSDGN